MPNNNTVPSHIYGFDHLRAILSIFVVFVHAGTISAQHVQQVGIEQILRFSFFYSAVPAFILISVFLYIAKDRTFSDLRKRIGRYLTLLLFWYFMVTVFISGVQGLINVYERLTVNVLSAFLTVISAGTTLYYFFVSLIVCVVLAHCCNRAPLWLKAIGLVASSILIYRLPFIASETNYHFLQLWFNPLNFLPYAFVALLIRDHFEFVQQHAFKLLIVCLIGCSAFAYVEWSLAFENPNLMRSVKQQLPSYTRVSLVFGATAIFIASLMIRKEGNFIIKFMSTYSLALYCLHAFVQPVAVAYCRSTFQNPIVIDTVSVVMVVAACYLAARILKNVLQDKMLF